MKKLFITLLCIGSLYSQESEMKTVDYVDIERFMGKWFVTAIVPNMIENGATNASDIYELILMEQLLLHMMQSKMERKSRLNKKGL